MLLYILIIFLIVVISIFIGYKIGRHTEKYTFINMCAHGRMFINEDDKDYATCGVQIEEDIEYVKKSGLVLLVIETQNRQRL